MQGNAGNIEYVFFLFVLTLGQASSYSMMIIHDLLGCNAFTTHIHLDSHSLPAQHSFNCCYCSVNHVFVCPLKT